MEEYPLGWKLVGQLLQRLIDPSEQSDNLPLVLKIIEPLRSGNRAAQVLAYCLQLVCLNGGTEALACKWNHRKLSWSMFGVQSLQSLSQMCKHNMTELEFTFTNQSSSNVANTTISVDETHRKRLMDLIASSTQGEITLYFRHISESVPNGFIPMCTQVMVHELKGKDC